MTLVGKTARLELLSLEHLDPLSAIGTDSELWRWTVTLASNIDEMRTYIETALQEQKEGRSLPFAIIDVATGRAVGSTRFGNIDKLNRHVEIGWTWLARNWQRTGINTEAKYLMLRYAFEELDCIRVELKTDALNERSRRAILRIGAKEEGTLRSHMITHTGRIRDTVYFSILDHEWPATKASLEGMLLSRRT
ncbi:MAG: GNAT family protein [Pyrinomonadaceae bacterium]